MRFLIDESIGKKFSDILNNSGYDAKYSGDSIPEVDDEYVLHVANKEGRVLITADKDFGKLIFKQCKSSVGVILIRSSITNTEKRFEIVKDSLDKAKGKFVIVREGQIRVRELK